MNLSTIFLKVGKAEGYSYLLLLFLAMPLKYIFAMPLGVQVVGMLHGILFLVFMMLLAVLFFKKTLSLKNALISFLLSLVPFGTFYLARFVK